MASVPAETMLLNPLAEADVNPRPCMEVGGYGDRGETNIHELTVQLAKVPLSKPAFVKDARACHGENAIHKLASTRKDRVCLPNAMRRFIEFIRICFTFLLKSIRKCCTRGICGFRGIALNQNPFSTVLTLSELAGTNGRFPVDEFLSVQKQTIRHLSGF